MSTDACQFRIPSNQNQIVRCRSLHVHFWSPDRTPWLCRLCLHPISGKFHLMKIMVEENFLNPVRNADTLVRHFKSNNNVQQHSFKIINIILKIKQPNISLVKFFFELHTCKTSYICSCRHAWKYSWKLSIYRLSMASKGFFLQKIAKASVCGRNDFWNFEKRVKKSPHKIRRRKVSFQVYRKDCKQHGHHNR